MRKRVGEAEAKVEDFRAKTNLFVGPNGTTLSSQTLGESNCDLAAARSQKAELEAKSKFIRDVLKRGAPVEYSDMINSELIRRLNEQRVTLARTARRAVLDAARRSSAHQGAEGADQRSGSPDPRRGGASCALVRERRAHCRRAGRIPARQPRPAQAAGGIDQRAGYRAARARARGKGAARSARILSRQVPRDDRARQPRVRADRYAHHLAGARVQHPVFPEEAADRAGGDARRTVHLGGLYHHGRASRGQRLPRRNACRAAG